MVRGILKKNLLLIIQNRLSYLKISIAVRTILNTFQLQVGKRVEVVSVQRLKPAFTADDEAPVEPPRWIRPPRQPPLVPPDPPRCRGRPRKAVAEASAVAPPKRRRVTFNLKPKILHQRLQR